PGYVPALSALGGHYGRAGNLSQALVYLEKARKRAPKEPGVLANLAIARAQQRRFEEARGLFNDLLEIQPSNLEARMNLCRMNIELKDWKAAADEVRTLWKARPMEKNVSALVQAIRPHLNAEEEARLKADLNAVLRARQGRR
ncbi:MAG: tetratricopeptide repeat protein, partial [Verrucomicrobiota bacterium]